MVEILDHTVVPLDRNNYLCSVMERNRIEVLAKMYEWAIERAGHTVGEFLEAHPKFAAYVSGEKQPTIKQLEQFAKSVHVPIAYLLLPEPPKEVSPIPMFRGKAGKGKFDLNVYQTILDVHGKQEWLSDYLAENEVDECPFVGKYDISVPVQDMAVIIRNYLGMEIDWMLQFRSPDKAVSFFVEKIESAGICVFSNGVVGNNSHRPLSVDECRGFALVSDTNAPMIFVNNRDSKTAQMFTLAHELTHVLVGVSAGYAGIDGDYQDRVETYCDKVAAEFIVPAILLNKNWTSIDSCAKLFNVSRLVIARRTHDLGLITDAEYRTFFLRYKASLTDNKIQSSGGDFYRTSAKRVGKLFAAYIYSAVRSEQLSYTEAYRLTGLYGRTFEKFMTDKI